MFPENFVIDLNSISLDEANIWIELEEEYQDKLKKKLERENKKRLNNPDNVDFAMKRLSGKR